MWCRYSKHTHILLVCLSLSLSPVPTQIPNLQCPTAIWNKRQYVGTRYKVQTLELEFLSMDRLKRGFDRHNLVVLMLSREGRKEGRGATRVSCRNCGSCINEYWMSERCL